MFYETKTNKFVVTIISAFVLFSERGLTDEPQLNQLEKKAIDYYSEFKSVVTCEVKSIYFFTKQSAKEGQDDIGKKNYYTFIVIINVTKSLSGEVKPGSEIACYVRFADNKLEMNGQYFLGFDGNVSNVFITENDNFCPVLEITKRNR